MTDDNDEHPAIQRYRTSVQKSTDSTEKSRIHTLETFVEWYDGELEDIDYSDVENFIIYCFEGRGHVSKTVASHYDNLRHFCNHLSEKEGVLEENPVETASPLSEWGQYTTKTAKEQALAPDEDVPSITPEEKEKMCDNVPSPKIRNELILRLLWQTGIRAHELRKIKLDYVDREERRIEIEGDKDEEHDRIVGYQPSLDILMNQYIDGGYRDKYATAKESDYLFVSMHNESLGKGTVNKMVKRAAENAGVQEPLYEEDSAGRTHWKVTAHTFRHSFAVQSLKNGMDIHYVKELLGHADVETTDSTYLQSPVEDNLDAQRKHGAGTENV